jgi:hypothetical protein
VVLDLVDRSLVKHLARGGRSRYTLLDTLRRYARGHLATQGQLLDAQERHVTHYLAMAEAIGHSCGAGQSDWIRVLDQEMPNLRAVHRQLLEQRDVSRLLEMADSLHYYAICSLNAEVFDWAADVIALPKVDQDPQAAAAYATAADGAWLAGHVDTSRALAERGMSFAALGDHPAGRYALASMANALAASPDSFERRAELYGRAAALASTAAMEPERVIAELARGACLVRLGREEEARGVAAAASLDARRLDSPDLEAKAEQLRADLWLGKDQEQAMAGYRRAAAIATQSGNRYQEYRTVISATFAEVVHGDDHTAAATFRLLLTHWNGLLRSGPLYCVLQGVVILLVGAHRHQEAAVLCGAVPPDTVTTAFTIDEEVVQRLAVAESEAQRHLGITAFEENRDRGRLMDRATVVAYALSALETVGKSADESAVTVT